MIRVIGCDKEEGKTCEAIPCDECHHAVFGEAPAVVSPLDLLVRWQHEDTGRLVDFPEGDSPGPRWFQIPAS